MWGTIFILVAVALLIPTAYAGLIGAPYAPTWLKVVRKAFDAIKLGQDDFLIDLGAGDGRIVLEASRRGARATGFELSPIMWAITKLRTIGKGGIHFGNFYKQDISEATVLFTFLMPKNMPRLKTWLATQAIPHGKYLLAYAFPLPDVAPFQTVTVPKEGTIYIYDLRKLTHGNIKT